MAGGAAFGGDGRYARLLGAAAWAGDARAAAAAQATGPPRSGPAHDLPHLADQEYTVITRTTAQLVKHALTELENTSPKIRAHSDRRREHTAEDVARTVDLLATALDVDDDLFTGYARWRAEVLTARRVPAAQFPTALNLLAGQPTDLPRATRMVAAAREAIGGRA